MTSLSGPLCKVGRGTRPAVFERTASVVGLQVQLWVPRGPTALPELQPAHLPLLREVSPQRPEGRCGAPTLGLPALPVGRCPGSVVDVPQEALVFGVQGCSSAVSLGDREDSLASAWEACWPAPWPGRRAVHDPPPGPAGLRAWPALGSCSWGGSGW